MQAQKARRRFMAALAAVVMTVAGAGAQTDVTGDWAFNVETGMGSGQPAISFKQTGEELTGTYSGTLGTANFKGSVKGTAITFSFTVDAQGQTIDVTYTGTVDGKTMKGAVSMAGGQLSGTFTGTKK